MWPLALLLHLCHRTSRSAGVPVPRPHERPARTPPHLSDPEFTIMLASLFAVGEAAHCEAERAQIATLEAETAVLRAKIAHAAPSDDPPPIPVLGVATIFHAGYVLRCFRSIDYPVETLVLVHNGDDEEVV